MSVGSCRLPAALAASFVFLLFSFNSIVDAIDSKNIGFSLYVTLNISREANESEIRRAYRRLSLEQHPDKAKPEDVETAEKIFQSINHAYKVLSNSKIKRLYDIFGDDMYTTQMGYYEALEERRVPELYKHVKGVHLIYEGNIDMLRNSPYTWIISFYQAGCGSCEQRVPFITQLGARTLSTKSVRLAMVNCAVSHMCQMFGIHHLGQIFFIPPQQQMGEVFDKIPYNGALSTEKILQAAKDVQSTLLDEIESDSIVVNNLKNLSTNDSTASGIVSTISAVWIVGYFRPTCSPCRVLKSAIRRMHQVLSKQVQISTINCDRHFCDVPYYPYIRLFVKERNGSISRHSIELSGQESHPGAIAISMIGLIFNTVLGLDPPSTAISASYSEFDKSPNMKTNINEEL